MAPIGPIATLFETVTVNSWMSRAWATTQKTFSRMVAMMFSHSFQVSNSSICLRRCSPSNGNHDVQLTPFKLHPPFVPRGTARGMLKKKLQTAWGGLQPARYERQSPPEMDTENRKSIQYWKICLTMYVNGEMFRMLGCHRVPGMRNLLDIRISVWSMQPLGLEWDSTTTQILEGHQKQFPTTQLQFASICKEYLYISLLT